MPIKISVHLGVDRGRFDATGALDTILDVDTRLFVDPHLLRKTTTSQLKGSHGKVYAYFKNIVHLLSGSKHPGDVFWKRAGARLHFPENNVECLCLGYSSADTSGSGIGRELQDRLLATARDIIDAGITDPEIFRYARLCSTSFLAEALAI